MMIPSKIRLPKCVRVVMFHALFFAMALPAVHAMPGISNDDFILILDQSGSMREKDPGNPAAGYEKNPMRAYKSRGAIDAINHMVGDILKQGDYFALIIFGNTPKLLLSQQIAYKHERDLIKDQVRTLLFKDQKTDILAGIKDASDLIASLDTPHRRKVMVMITDGTEDLPVESEFSDSERQTQVYEELRDTIRFNKWNVVLVGIGEYTQQNIRNIAQRLALPPDRAKTVKDPQSSKEITDILTDIIEEQQKAFVKLEKDEIRLRLEPGIFGGYGQVRGSLALKSFFNEPVEVSLKTKQPVRFGNDALAVSASPITLSFAPRESQNMEIVVSFNGKRPDQGWISGKFSFNFSEASTRFYPNEGHFQVILPSWWEVYGVSAMIALTLVLGLIILTIWAVRRAMVPEIRISVTVNNIPLGESMTIRRKQSFMIADGQFGGLSVPAKGLSCDTAAQVRYLGRRKFEIRGIEAKIISEGTEHSTLPIVMDSFFDLKDAAGKVMRSVMITTAGQSSDDPFGGAHGHDAF